MRQSRRRGKSEVQWVVIAGVLVIVLVATWQVFGPRPSNQAHNVAEVGSDPIAQKNQGQSEEPSGR